MSPIANSGARDGGDIPNPLPVSYPALLAAVVGIGAAIALIAHDPPQGTVRLSAVCSEGSGAVCDTFPLQGIKAEVYDASDSTFSDLWSLDWSEIPTSKSDFSLPLVEYYQSIDTVEAWYDLTQSKFRWRPVSCGDNFRGYTKPDNSGSQRLSVTTAPAKYALPVELRPIYLATETPSRSGWGWEPWERQIVAADELPSAGCRTEYAPGEAAS